MRKYLIGFALGLFLSIGITSYAEEIETVVGKMVQGTFHVYLDGERLDREAIVIDGGVSYLPVREVTDRLDLDIKFDQDRGIDLFTRAVVNNDTPEWVGQIISYPNSWTSKERYIEPEKDVDSSIEVIEVNGIKFYNLDDYNNTFGNVFSYINGRVTINKEDGTVVHYVDNNPKQVQLVNNRLYVNIKSYPKLPGYPDVEFTQPKPQTHESLQERNLQLQANELITDGDIEVVTVDGIEYFSVGDYIVIFGNNTESGAQVFYEFQDMIFITKHDGKKMTYIDGEPTQVQRIEDKLYLNIEAYPH